MCQREFRIKIDRLLIKFRRSLVILIVRVPASLQLACAQIAHIRLRVLSGLGRERLLLERRETRA